MLSSTIFPQLRSVIDNTKNPFEHDFYGSEILCLLFDDNYGYILAGGNNRNINIWNIQTGERVDTLREHKDSVTCLAIEQKLLFSGSDDMTIVIWDLFNKWSVGTLEGHQHTIQDMIVFEETGLLVSCSYDKKIIVWQYETKSIVEQFERNEEFKCLDYISSTKIMIAGTNDKTIMTFPI